MTISRRNGILLAGLMLILGIAVLKTRKLAASRDEGALLRKEMSQIEMEMAKRQSARDRLRRDAEAAEMQLAEIPAVNRSSGYSAREAAVGDWFARLRRLRRAFVEHPEWAIPEMALLTEAEWLFAAKISPLDAETDLRWAAAQLRAKAKSDFSSKLAGALRRHPTAVTSAAPFDILALGPFFDEPVDPAILRRYEIVSLPKRGAPNGDVFVLGLRERSAVDPVLDTRVEIVNGLRQISGPPTAWVPDFQRRAERARVRYQAANPTEWMPPGVPPQILPYFDPPLPKDVAERIVAAENGRSP